MIAIIDYGAGNLTSVDRAVKYLGYVGENYCRFWNNSGG